VLVAAAGLAAFDAITRQQRPARERVRSPPLCGGRMLPASQGLGILIASRGTERALTISSSQARHGAGTRGARRWLLSVGCARRQPYTPCDTTMGGQTITLNGHDLTIGQIISVARHGGAGAI